MRNCCSVAFTPVVGSVNDVASVRLRTDQMVSALSRLSKSTDASIERVPENRRPPVLPVLLALWKGESQAPAAQG